MTAPISIKCARLVCTARLTTHGWYRTDREERRWFCEQCAWEIEQRHGKIMFYAPIPATTP